MRLSAASCMNVVLCCGRNCVDDDYYYNYDYDGNVCVRE